MTDPTTGQQIHDAAYLGTSVIALITAWLGVLSLLMTILATLATLVWSCIKIYETKVVQCWLQKRRKKA